MQIYRVKTTISSDGTLIIEELPFRPGDKVEVVVRSRGPEPERIEQYPLRGKPIRYVDPFEGIAVNDWDVLQ
jgi:hypothetical protein